MSDPVFLEYLSEEVWQLEIRCGHARFAAIWISIRLMHRECYERVPFAAAKYPLVYLMSLAYIHAYMHYMYTYIYIYAMCATPLQSHAFTLGTFPQEIVHKLSPLVQQTRSMWTVLGVATISVRRRRILITWLSTLPHSPQCLEFQMEAILAKLTCLV